MANFDNDLRQSLPRYSNSHVSQSSPNPSSSYKSPNKSNTSSPGSNSNSNQKGTIFLPPYIEKPVASEIITERYQGDNPNIFAIQ